MAWRARASGSTSRPSELARAARSSASAPLRARASSRSRMIRRATSSTAAVSTCGSRAVFRASAATAWRIAAPGSSCGWGWPGRSHSPSLRLRPRRPGGRHRAAAGGRAVPATASSASSSRPREPDLDARGGGGDRVQPGDEGLRLGTPDAGSGLAGRGRTGCPAEAPWCRPGTASTGRRGPGWRRPGFRRRWSACGAPGARPAPRRSAAGARREQPGSYARARSRSRRRRRSGSISVLASSQSKARVRAGIVPLSRQARTIGLASAVAAYSRMVSCHQGSLTLSARLFTRSGVAPTCRAARYSWNVRWVKAYRPAARLDEQAVARDVVEERLAGDRRRGTARAAGRGPPGCAVGGQVADVIAHHLVGEHGQQRLLGGPGQRAPAGSLACPRRESSTWQISPYRSARLAGSAPR